jgi:hypothetical protein
MSEKTYTMGDPRVFFTNPHPYLQIPVLTPTGTGFDGYITGSMWAHGVTGSHGIIGLRHWHSLPGREEEGEVDWLAWKYGMS